MSKRRVNPEEVVTKVDIRDAKTHLSCLVDQVAAGETILIARDGHPVAKLTPVDSPSSPQRLGFLAGQSHVPDDFNEWGRDEVVRLLEEGA